MAIGISPFARILSDTPPLRPSTSQNHNPAPYPQAVLLSSGLKYLNSTLYHVVPGIWCVCRVYLSYSAMLSMVPCSFSLGAEALRSRRGLPVLHPRRDCKLSMESGPGMGDRSSGKSCSVRLRMISRSGWETGPPACPDGG